MDLTPATRLRADNRAGFLKLSQLHYSLGEHHDSLKYVQQAKCQVVRLVFRMLNDSSILWLGIHTDSIQASPAGCFKDYSGFIPVSK